MFDIDADLASILADDRATLPAREADAIRAAGSAQDLVRRMFLAWDRMDPFELIAVGRALDRTGELAGKHRLRFSVALTAMGSSKEAVRALAPLAQDDQADVQTKLAAALAAAGAFVPAQAAITRALELLPGHREATELQRPIRLVRKHLGRAAWSWEVADRLLPALLLLQARGAAADLVRRMVEAGPALDAQSAPHAAGLALTGMKLVPAKMLSPLVKALARDFGSLESVQAARLGWLVRRGRSADAAELALTLPAGENPVLALASAEALDAAGDVAGALARLVPLASRHKADPELRTWLAYCTGRLALEPPPAFAAPRPPRVINLFPFYNELTILKIRLREMADWVDHFVIVEAGQTFTGAPKPYYLDDFKAAVAEFEPKIIRARLPAFSEPVDALWAREFYQRDVAVTALAGLWRPDDRVLVTDVDEIVDRRALEGLDVPLASLRMQTHSHFLNYCAKPDTPFATRRSGFVCRAGMLQRFGSTYVRIGLLDRLHEWWGAPRAGWHLTSIGDAKAISDKFRNFSHQEPDKAPMRDLGQTAERLERLRRGELDEGWERRRVDDSFPAYIREHQDELRPLLLDGD